MKEGSRRQKTVQDQKREATGFCGRQLFGLCLATSRQIGGEGGGGGIGGEYMVGGEEKVWGACTFLRNFINDFSLFVNCLVACYSDIRFGFARASLRSEKTLKHRYLSRIYRDIQYFF
mgnify:CR=1 FL=1